MFVGGAARTSAAAIGFCALAWAQPAPVRQDGREWVQLATGNWPVPAAVRMKIVTQGPVKLVRGPEGSLHYQLRKRSDAGQGRPTDEQFQAVRLVSRRRGDTLIVVLAGPEQSAVNTELTLQVPRVKQLLVTSENGPIEAYDLETDLQALSAGGRIQMDRIQGNLIARTGGGEIVLGQIKGTVRSYSAGGSIRVQHAGGESWFETAGGDIFVGDALGPVHASTAGGGVQIQKAASTVVAQTAGGRIDVGEAGGAVIAENSAGPIQVGNASTVKCEATAGTIRLHRVSGALRATTDRGSIVADLSGVPSLRDSFFRARLGDVTVLLPSTMAITVRVQSTPLGTPGRVVSDFPELRRLAAGASGASMTEGSLNGGGPVLLISAAQGTIYLRRQK